MMDEDDSKTSATSGGDAATADGSGFEVDNALCDAEDSFNGLTILLRQVLSDLTHAVDRTLASHALTFAKSLPLIALLDGQRHTTSSIAREVRCDAGAMTRIISDLEDKGLIKRERSRDDRRVVYLQLTETGQAVARDVPAVLREVMEANLACLAIPERQMLTGLLRRVCAKVHTENSASCTEQAGHRDKARRTDPVGAQQTDRQAPH